MCFKQWKLMNTFCTLLRSSFNVTLHTGEKHRNFTLGHFQCFFFSWKFLILLFCAQSYSISQQFTFISFIFTNHAAIHCIWQSVCFFFIKILQSDKFYKWTSLTVESLDEGGDVDSGNSTSHSPEDSFRWLLTFLTQFDILIKLLKLLFCSFGYNQNHLLFEFSK